MTGINHALTGAMIGFSIGNPILVVPLAFASHFVLDTMPHFGEKFGQRTKLSKFVWTLDAIMLSFFLSYLLVSSQRLLLLGAVLAISPDFAWIYRFTAIEKLGSLPPPPANKFNSWHASIQKLETKPGILAEIVWAVFFSTAFVVIL